MINEAIQQGALLAGRMKGGLPRQIKEMLEPEVNWREEMADFTTAAVKGADEITWRKFNRRHLADDRYAPSSISETVGEVVWGIDTSGSINARDIAAGAAELASICEVCQPERVRVLWWDTEVHGEQIFEQGDYAQIKDLLKPLGGGGTRASCVSQYVEANNIFADCVIVLTDGYCESNIQWNISMPTMWLVKGNTAFIPPSGGRLVKFDANK